MRMLAQALTRSGRSSDTSEIPSPDGYRGDADADDRSADMPSDEGHGFSGSARPWNQHDPVAGSHRDRQRIRRTRFRYESLDDRRLQAGTAHCWMRAVSIMGSSMFIG
ncbi:hypothetical protein IQ26_04124 [Mesorhizobium tianshanense]|uniref:Uncharacterized protein n=1 Tax=Mesorhizobium tianshanense TaxID=39844 RepID=A0A562NLR0_9HYPH|nr:hypothetical protein IQ26_04124 [Mesorhizobium tianshanense]